MEKWPDRPTRCNKSLLKVPVQGVEYPSTTYISDTSQWTNQIDDSLVLTLCAFKFPCSSMNFTSLRVPSSLFSTISRVQLPTDAKTPDHMVSTSWENWKKTIFVTPAGAGLRRSKLTFPRRGDGGLSIRPASYSMPLGDRTSRKMLFRNQIQTTNGRFAYFVPEETPALIHLPWIRGFDDS